MITSQQVRLALRKLRTDANLEPNEFADEAGVHRSTVYRIEKLEQRYSPKIETISALAESRGFTLTEFFARLEGIPAKEAGYEIGEDEKAFLDLPADVRKTAIGFAVLLGPHLSQAPPNESRHEPPQGTRTKSGGGRRR